MIENRTSERDLELRLIGPVRLFRRDGVDLTPKGRKAQGLLALLGVSPQYRRTRSWLQDKLWSDRGAEQGGASLRQELAGLRRALGASSGCLLTEAGWVGLDPAKVHVSLEPDPEDWDLTGTPPEFAAGLDIADPEFEDWIRDQRAALEETFAARPARPVASRIARIAPPPDPAELTPSIAVMPLECFSEVPGSEFVATGIALDVVGRITRYRRVDVIAYASTLAIAPLRLTPREIGQRLGVRYIVQGGVRLGRTRMRLDVSLIDAATEKVLWSEIYDRSFEDIFEVEADVAISLTSGIMVEIEQQELARVRARDPRSLDAYGLCMRALDDMLQLNRAGCDSALDLFTRAEEREQRYARALSGISRAHGFYWKYRWAEDRDAALARADEFALRAVDSDVNDASSNAALGWVALYERNHDRSLAAYSRAMELNPSDADILAEYADALQHSGSPNEAIPLFQRAVRLNPQMSDIYKKDLSGAYLKAENYDEAIRTIRGMRRWQIADLTLVASLVLAGQEQAARDVASTVRQSRPNFSAEAWITMIPDLHYEDTARFLEALKRAGL